MNNPPILPSAERGHPNLVPYGFVTGGHTLFHVASNGKLNEVTMDLLTEENILRASSSGVTVLHEAAKHDQLNFLPVEYLTKENLSLEDAKGNAPWKYAALKGNWSYAIDRDLTAADREFLLLNWTTILESK